MLEHPPSTIFLAQGGIGLGCFVAPSYVWDTLQVPTVSPVVSCETAWVGDSLLASAALWYLPALAFLVGVKNSSTGLWM